MSFFSSLPQNPTSIFSGSTLLGIDPSTGIATWRTRDGNIVTNDPSKHSPISFLKYVVPALMAAGVGSGLGLFGSAAAGGAGGGTVAGGSGSGALAGGAGAAGAVDTLGAGAAGATGAGGAAASALPALATENVLVTGGLAGAAGGLSPAALAALGVGGLGLAAAGGGFGGGASSLAPVNIAPDTPPGLSDAALSELGVGSVGAIVPGALSAVDTQGSGLSTSDILKGAGLAATVGGAASGAGGGLGTTSSTSTQILSPEQIAYLKSQQALADKQLEFLGQQGDFQQGYLASIQPLLDQQAKLMQQQYDTAAAEQSDPYNVQNKQLSNQLLQSQLDSQNQLAPLQQKLLQYQLDQAANGGRPTPEQIASIDEATRQAFATGSSQIQDFSGDALRQLREELAPGLGLRSTDTPILDRGGFIQQAATRQAGQLSSSLAAANAQARLDYPLAQQQVGNATAANTANIAQAAQDFQAQLAQNAVNNRLNLLSAGRGSTDLGLTSGTNLVSAARGNPLNFGSSTSSTSSNPAAGLSSLLGGIGGLATGLGNLGLFSNSGAA